MSTKVNSKKKLIIKIILIIMFLIFCYLMGIILDEYHKTMLKGEKNVNL